MAIDLSKLFWGAVVPITAAVCLVELVAPEASAPADSASAASPAQAAPPAGLKPYDGDYDPLPEVIVDRTWTGRCPRGYTDHPSDPARCMLPAAAAQEMARVARRYAPREEVRIVTELPAEDPVAALNAEMERRYETARQREQAREDMRRAVEDALREERRRAQRE
ncbi:MAG: hypothetical protein KatS3mg122_2099 [Caldimonas sp.]|jgi:hypothetical protein|nr:MAG: hypothetical protein KatS3mg122_2099 [Caldimonas sp.]